MRDGARAGWPAVVVHLLKLRLLGTREPGFEASKNGARSIFDGIAVVFMVPDDKANSERHQDETPDN